jgi:hypothetical protein
MDLQTLAGKSLVQDIMPAQRSLLAFAFEDEEHRLLITVAARRTSLQTTTNQSSMARK